MKFKNKDTIIKTRFGNANIDSKGYYSITSSKEGNFRKYLHRLIWEDHYGKPVPKGYDIHHINGDKLDNRIQNLQCVKHNLHVRFHKKGKKCPNFSGENHPMYGKHHTEEARKKMSEVKKGENHPQWKDYARITKAGFKKNGKQNYAIRYEGKIIKSSINKNKLEKIVEKINKEGVKNED